MNRNQNKRINQIYDKCIKKCLTLSNKAVINFINGCFNTNYSIDSKITYNWTEGHDDELNRTIADGILTINDTMSYHFEAQMGEDEEMQFRVFEYGYRHALHKRNGRDVLEFPEPIIIYLYKHGKTPDVYSIFLDFGSQGSFEYKVNTYKLLEHSVEEIESKKMIILIPFMILRFREEIEKVRTKDSMLALKDFILNDIISAIDKNVDLGNLTLADAGRLRNLVGELYRHVFSHYSEFQEEGINDMVDEGLVLEMDIIEYNHKKELEKKEKEVTQEVTKEVTKEVVESSIIKMLQRGDSFENIQMIFPDVTSEQIQRIQESLKK